MKKIIYIGGTGSGKTYNAINTFNNFVLIVPCRQLAYDIFIDYDKITALKSGEVTIINGNDSNMVAVYESVNFNTLNNFKTIIIDEAHFLTDETRGEHLYNLIENAEEKGLNIILLTATNNLPEYYVKNKGFDVIELKPYKKIEKIFLEDEEDLENILKENNKLSMLYFNARSPSNDYYIDEKIEYLKNLYNRDDLIIEFISANTPVIERIEIQNRFKNREVDILFSTNVLAQGVNLPADIVYIEYNYYDEAELIHQKIGRAGRIGYSDKGYFFLECVDDIPKIYKKDISYEEQENAKWYYRNIIGAEDIRFCDLNIEDWGFKQFQVPELYGLKVNGEKLIITKESGAWYLTYARQFLKELVRRNLANEFELKLLADLEEKAKKAKEKLLKMKGK